MIHLDRLTYRYPRRSTPALSAITEEMAPGSYTVVAGPSGAGKSTLLRALNGLVPHFYGGVFGGRVLVQGIDTRRVQPADLGRIVGFVGQDPERQTVMDRVEDEIAFGPENYGLPRHEIRLRVEEALDLLGIAPLRDREIASLSGGERQRVVIAAAMAMRPPVLALDEPTSQLDPWSAEAVLSVLDRLHADLGTTVVIAEHRLDRVLPSAERVLLLGSDGSIVASGPPRSVAAALQYPPPLVRLGLALGWDPLPLTVREGRRLAQSMPPPVTPLNDPSAGGDVVLEVQGVTFRYGERTTLRDVSAVFREGTVTALMGRNGAGKTTLLKHLNGLLRPAAGRILLRGQDIAGTATPDLARTVAYLPQNPSAMLFNETVAAEVRFTLRALGLPGDVGPALEMAGVAHLAARNPRDLSTGERQRVALAAVLASAPAVLLLDEPTRGLDGEARERLIALLRRLAGIGTCVVMATHDVELAAVCADRVLLLGDGEVVADGPPRQVLTGSLTYATQINRIFGGRALVLEDIPGFEAHQHAVSDPERVAPPVAGS
ncbi:ABC transporter ATP-binding protein [Sphaerobacter thermophilus]|uniref:ABC transporter related protein n=1 Tax=Sphaerobacter thermophilus (strain ATCC 49802 / DSM 20745 / KCCM 41009 / NCIMB 13125 / S 6022) TaxID=479434 RepID=D1C296_SPHTD|nr:ATP-binding cassette domain-containing protein [Sphaerobacter thermophilus]ACZ38363.1 ABC transporter related protein [Sphaerobacter thermophilus DSM 20745]